MMSSGREDSSRLHHLTKTMNRFDPNLPEPSNTALGRRAFLSRAGLLGTAAAMAPAFAGAIFNASNANAVDLPPQGIDRDVAILNFALQLEYLEAEYYTLADQGKTIDQVGVGIDGRGTPGVTTFKPNPKVPFAVPIIQQYASEIAKDELNHVKFLRGALQAAGLTPAAKPAINLNDAWDTAAKAAGIADTFNPFADDISFLIGAFIFEDVGVTAYHGAAPLITNKGYLKAAAGILAVEAYHAAEVRTVLLGRGGDFAISAANKISALRAALSYSGGDDQGITDASGNANIVPTDDNSIVFSRGVNSVLNIVYGAKGATKGLFFPNGVNL